MAVPDTTNFHLTDVFTELGLPINGTNGLVQCFAAADPAQFDPAYEGSKNSLLNFRNYGAGSVQSFLIHLTPFMSSGAACAHILTDTTMYYFGSSTYPSPGDTIYTDSGLTSPFNGGGSWYKLGNNTSAQIDSSGLVLLLSLC